MTIFDRFRLICAFAWFGAMVGTVTPHLRADYLGALVAALLAIPYALENRRGPPQAQTP